MTDLDYVEFFKLFETFEHTVFQFETRESYAGVATKPFSHFLAGDLTKVWDTDAPWLQNVRAQTAKGMRYARVRVVSEPWSDYTRFGLWECRTSIEAGEDIRYLSRERAVALSLPQHDFRLFDSQALVILHYEDATSKFLRRELITHFAAVIRHNYWRDVAWHHALPRDDYVEQVGELVIKP